MEKHYISKDTAVVEDPLADIVDILSFNQYVGWYDGLPEKCGQVYWKIPYDKPVFISEFGGGAKYGYHGDKNVRWTEEFQEDLYVQSLKMLDKIGIDAIQASIFTPLPGTPIFERMKERIHDRNWEHYDYRHVVFKPAKMNGKDLQAGTDWVIRRFYSLPKIFSRSFRWLFIPGGIKNFIYPFVLSQGYYGRVKRFEIKGYNPVKKKKLSFKILIRNSRYSLLKLNGAFRHMQRKEKVAYS